MLLSFWPAFTPAPALAAFTICTQCFGRDQLLAVFTSRYINEFTGRVLTRHMANEARVRQESLLSPGDKRSASIRLRQIQCFLLPIPFTRYYDAATDLHPSLSFASTSA